MNEQEFCKLITKNGGRLYIAGGWVRDYLRRVVPQDKDYVISGLPESQFRELFPAAEKIGKAFPVYLLTVDNKPAEIAFARAESKMGSGYRGFAVAATPDITIEADLYRRDTTMNSIAICVATGELIDPFNGKRDIDAGIIRATSVHFSEDPVRALRAARQAAQMGFAVSDKTLAMMRCCGRELLAEPRERVVKEFTKALACDKPSVFFQVLQAADLLASTFPQLYALIGQTQPAAFHPEGDAFVHSLQVVDRSAVLSKRLEVRFAALVHDIGKGLTKPAALPHHYGHETAGLRALADFNQLMTLPKLWLVCAKFAIAEHMRVTVLRKPGKIVDFLLRLAKNPLQYDGMAAIVAADNGSLPPVLANYTAAMQAINGVNGHLAPAMLTGKAIGEWLRQQQIIAYQNCIKGVSDNEPRGNVGKI